MSYGIALSTESDSTCILHSVVETCRLNERKSVEYLKEILSRELMIVGFSIIK